MSKRTILLLTYRDPESDGETAIPLAVVAAPTKAKALSMMKAQAKVSFRELEESRGSLGDYKLTAYVSWRTKKKDTGSPIGHFNIMGSDGSGPCDDDFIVTEVPTLLIV